MRIRETKRFGKNVFEAVNNLLPQLDQSAGVLTEEKFKSILRSEGTHFFVAESDTGKIIGILSAVVYHIPTGTKFWIEDVVVDYEFRGKGIGKALMIKAMDLARTQGAKAVDLTSRPSRAAANRLYQELGFKLRETNVYRCTL